jgi:hypothetical protein
MITLYVLPNYYAGHTYTWDVAKSFSDPGPWTFIVQENATGEEESEDGWTDLSEPLTNLFSFQDTFKVLHSKDFLTVYRVVMTTPGGVYKSPSVGPYNQLPRTDFLLARDIMRRELLDMREYGGVPVNIWKKDVISDPCEECVDLVTGQVIDPDCPVCGGTGTKEGWNGPYDGFGKFSPRKSNKSINELTMEDVQLFSVRILAYPFLIRNDLLVDMTSDRRYSIEKVESAFEMRRIPIIYDLTVAELVPSDSRYRLGSGYGPGEERCL